MDEQTKIRLLNRMVDRYCLRYLKGTKNGRCDGQCPFVGLCSIGEIEKNYRKVEEIFENLKQKKLAEIMNRSNANEHNQLQNV